MDITECGQGINRDFDEREAQAALAASNCSADTLQRLSYEAWLALGPEKAAEYIARRMDLSDYRKRKLALILKTWWEENPPNRTRSAMSDKCPHHVRRNHACPICARISQALAESELAAPTGLAAVSRKWRDQANTLAKRANELSANRRDKDAADMRARASVYFICADDLDKQQSS